MINVQTGSLITMAVKKTNRGLVARAAMSTPVLRGGFMPQQNAVHGIKLTAHAVLLQLPPDVRPIIKLTVRELLPVPIPAVIPVTDVVMIPARQGLLKTIPGQFLHILNAEQPAKNVKAAHQAPALLIPGLLLLPLNAELATNAAIPAVPVMKKNMPDLQNADQAAINV